MNSLDDKAIEIGLDQLDLEQRRKINVHLWQQFKLKNIKNQG